MTSPNARPFAAHSVLSHQRDALHIDRLVTVQNIVGDNGNNTLTGTGGDDVIDISQGGNDTVKAKNGDDIINAGAALNAADKIDGGLGNDTLNLNGNLTIVFKASTVVNVETINVSGGQSYNITTSDATVAAGGSLLVAVADFNNNPLHFDGSAETDGRFEIKGGVGNDTMIGGAGNDQIDLYNGGNDTAFGGAGNDTFIVTPGSFDANDRIDGGTQAPPGPGAFDLLYLLGTFTNQVINGTMLQNVELIDFAPDGFGFTNNTYHLTLTDDAATATNKLSVYGGDMLSNNSAFIDDTAETDVFVAITGGDGNDTILLGVLGYGNGGLGNDTISGQGGPLSIIAFYDHHNGGAGVKFSIAKEGAAQDTGGAGIDTVSGIPNVFGSQYNDKLTGDGHANVLAGNGGSDVLLGAGGDDYLTIGPGTTVADGGAGSDTAVFHGFVDAGQGYVGAFTGGVTVTLATPGVQQDFGQGLVTLTNVENLSGSAFDDTLTGDGNANTLAGADGDDTLNGLGGDDILWGDGGSIPNSGTFENPYGFLNIYGGSDTLNGGAGNDTLIGGGGKDAMNGGADSDTFVYNAGSDSTGAGFDVITGFDAAADSFDLPIAVSSIRAAVKAGALSDGTFDADLAGVLKAGKLGVHQAVLYTPNGGDEAGHMFLVVDMNGTAGYQAGDLVIQLVNGAHLGTLDTGNFI